MGPPWSALLRGSGAGRVGTRQALATLVAVAAATIGACAGAQSGAHEAVDLLTYDPVLDPALQAVDRFVLDLPWELHNRGGTPAAVGAVRWSAEVSDDLGPGPRREGQQTVEVDAPSGGRAGDRLRIEIPLDTTAEGLGRRESARALRWEVTARFEVAAGGRSEIYEAEWRGEASPPRPPRVTLAGQAGRYGDQGFELGFRVGIVNPNPFPQRLTGLDYALHVHDTELSAGTLARDQELAPASEVQFDVHQFVGPGEHDDLAERLRGLDAIPYRLTGTLHLQGLALPVRIEGSIALPR